MQDSLESILLGANFSHSKGRTKFLTECHNRSVLLWWQSWESDEFGTNHRAFQWHRLCITPIDDAGDIEVIVDKNVCCNASPNDIAGMDHICALQPPLMLVLVQGSMLR
jgi:hypothetical protein